MGKKTAMILGWVFLVLGVLGFFSNPLVGNGALFHADMNHNLVHLISGAILLWVAYKAANKSAMVLKVLGVVYLLVAVLGFFMEGSVLGLLEVNGAVNLLHLVLGVWLLVAGIKEAKRGVMPMTNPAPMQ
jgi:hypothetical protein